MKGIEEPQGAAIEAPPPERRLQLIRVKRKRGAEAPEDLGEAQAG
jgi:hypothetical protein